jgi:ketose-bisphosphate aldolase
MKLIDYLSKAKKEHCAVGHFNFSTADQLKAIVTAAAEEKAPIMVATSEGEADFIGHGEAVALVKAHQKEGKAVFLNADHHKSWETIQEAIDTGYDSIHIDGSALPYEENVTLTKKVVDYARSKNPDVSIEGELGHLRGESKVQSKVEIDRDDFTKPEQVKDFVQKTGVDRLAVVVGNIHGITTDQKEELDFGLLEEVTKAVPETTIVLHGASGLTDYDIKKAISLGVSNIHINTEIRVAYIDALKEAVKKEPQETTPYKLFAKPFGAIKETVKTKIKLFNSAKKI